MLSYFMCGSKYWATEYRECEMALGCGKFSFHKQIVLIRGRLVGEFFS